MNDCGETFPPTRSRRWVAPLVAVLSLGAAGGAGYFAWQEHQDAAGLRQERGNLTQELSAQRNSGASFTKRLSSCTRELESEKGSRKDWEGRLVAAETELVSCRASVTDLTKQKEEFQALTQKFRRMIDTGKLEVIVRKGKMVVKLPDAILFPSGSAELIEGGLSTLSEVAGILRQMRGRRFTIAGHTDNVPLSNAPFKSNWELSTARAVKVLEMLVRKGVRPQNLVAAGYSEFDPVATNRTSGGRQRNRRIEIILEPALSRVPVQRLISEKKKTSK